MRKLRTFFQTVEPDFRIRVVAVDPESLKRSRSEIRKIHDIHTVEMEIDLLKASAVIQRR